MPKFCFYFSIAEGRSKSE